MPAASSSGLRGRRLQFLKGDGIGADADVDRALVAIRTELN
jgi:hypothetical protein